MAIRTEKAIFETFEEMLDESSFEKITVSALAKRCEISPNTFYYHYEDLYDLLIKWLEVKKLDWIVDNDWKQSIKNFLLYCKNNEKKIYHISSSLSRESLERFFFKYVSETFKKQMEFIVDNYNFPKDVADEMSDFILYGLVGTFLKFIFNGMKDDVDDVVDSVASILDGYIEFCLHKYNKI